MDLSIGGRSFTTCTGEIFAIFFSLFVISFKVCTSGGIGVAAEVNDDIGVVTADNDIDDTGVTVGDDDIGVTDLDGGVSINGNGWLTACSALLPNQGVVHIPGDECFTVYSLCHNLSKTYVCFLWMSSIAEETKLNCS